MASTHFGIQKRSKPALQFVVGYDGQQTSKLQKVAPFKTGEKIMSGMLISLTYVSARSRYEWVAGLVANAIPHLALNDYDDPDVKASGNLLIGYPLSSEIEVRTPYARLTADDTSSNTSSWDDNAALAGVARDPDAAFTEGTDGYLKLAQTGNQIIGYLSGGHINGLIDVASENSNVERDGNGKVLVAQLTANFAKGNLAA